MPRFLIAAGGTGGHILPGLAVARVLRRRGHGVHFVVKQDQKTPAVIAHEGFACSAFHFEGFPRGMSWSVLGFPLKVMAAYGSARRVLRREQPAAVLGMGGYITVPVGIAARGRAPLVVHEQNRVAGLANRLLSRWSRAVAATFDSTEGLSSAARVVQTGLPLREDLAPMPPEEARQRLGLDPRAPTLLVFGGSQGARSLNSLLLNVVARWRRERPEWQYIHLTGPGDEHAAKEIYREGRAHVRAFTNDMAAAYSAADFVVARAGANSVRELWRMGCDALLVPYPYATDDHQLANARWLQDQGRARVALERDLTVEGVLAVLRGLPPLDRLRQLRGERGGAPQPDERAADRLSDLLESVVEIKERP